MAYAPRPFARPRASNPIEARALYEHKLDKRWPFQTAPGYDWEDMEDYRKWGKAVRPDCLPLVKGIEQDNAYFWLHSQSVARDGSIQYTFIHLITENGNTRFRPLMFTDFSGAYRYAIAYGCKINKKPDYIASILDFMAEAMDDIDMFVERISTNTHKLNIISTKNLLGR